MFNRKIIILLSLFCLIICIIPMNYAQTNTDNLTITDNNTILTDNHENNIIQANNDYYFNASLDRDGDGSINNPYKYLRADRIKSNSNLYLANGLYELDLNKIIYNVNIIGTDPDKTIMSYNGNAFTVNNCLNLSNLTLKGISITNKATLTATNTIFTEGHGNRVGSYGDTFGGVIYTKYVDENTNAKVTLNNCTFKDNYAVYGGAIYMQTGYLNITQSQFINNLAYNYGGAIACEHVNNITISKSKFIKNHCLDDAGGAIYIKKAKSFKATNIDIINSTATFGGAITTLNSDVLLSYINIYNNTAKWDGGAIYHMYGKFTSTYSNFTNNTARNGGALFIDNSTTLILRANKFINNSASICGGALYSLLNTIKYQLSSNTYIDNNAPSYPKFFTTTSLNLTIGNGNYTQYHINDTQIGNLPSFYNAFEHNYLTPVKDQQAGGNCWAFAALAVLEANIKKLTGTEFDFSEENMKNMMALYSDYGQKMDTNDGGNMYMSLAYFTSWMGPVNESDDVYDDYSVLSPLFDSLMHVQNIMFLKRESYTDNDDIKEAILKYGAVATTMWFDNSFIRGINYYTQNHNINHGVTIVGWDDNYPKQNFKTAPPGDGAWIIRNSWGPTWGDYGYFYVSYYDESLARSGNYDSYTYILNDTVKFDKNYQYDIAGVTDYLYDYQSNVWYKNKFTASDSEVLAAVSTYFEKVTNWTVSVYVNGVLKTVKNGVSNAGYWTINLDNPVMLFIGDEFEIVFNTTCSGFSAVPISESLTVNKVVYTPNSSFISYDGSKWIDLYDYFKIIPVSVLSTHTYYSQTACIKAFTYLTEYNTTTYLNVSYNDYNPVNITATVIDEFGNYAIGDLKFNLSGVEYTVKLVNGKASFLYNFDKGLNNISCVFNNKGYITSSNSTIIEIFKKDLIIQVNITKIINDLVINVTANDTINQNIIININDKNYTAKLENGKFTGILSDLENGNYTIRVFLEDTSIYEPDIISPQVFNIDFIKTSIISYNMVTSDFTGEEFTIQLIDEDKNPLSNKTIIFKLNNENYTTTTDFNGTASVKINLTNGVYIITTIFQGDENYTDTTVNNIINVRLKTEINLTYTKYQNTVVLNVTLSKPITDNANILINNESGEFKIINGKTSLNITFFENNNYNITVYLNDNYYDCTPSKINFTVNVKHTQITAYNVTVNDEGDYYNITLKDEDGNLLSNKTLIITLNNTTYNKTTVNGTVTLPINLKRGLYPIIINYTGEDNYFPSYSKAEIYSKTNIDCEIKIQTLLYTAILNITFSKPVNKIRVQVGDKVYSKLLNQGKTQFNINNLSNGVYNITVKIVDEGYNFTQASSNFTINVIKTQLIADNFTTTDNIINNYTVTLTDENNNTLSDKQIQIILNNNTYSKYTDNNGQVSIPINLTNGDYLIKVIYSNITDKYDTSIITRNIHVKMKINANMSFERKLNNINLNITFTRPINDTGIITIGDNSYIIKITNGTSSSTLNNLSNGNYTIQLNLNDWVYDFNELSVNFTINVKHTQINASNKTIYYQSGSGFKIFLFDEDNNPLKDKYIRLTSGNITYLEKTDENACIEIIPYDLSIGVYDFEILFNGDNDYYSSQNKSRITILSSISLAENTNYTLNSTYIVKLYGEGPLVNCPVNISVNGVNYNLTTDGEGIVKLNIGFDVGSYIISIVNPQTLECKNQTINVLARLSENTNIIMYYGANKYYAVKVFDDYGQTVPAGVYVNFNLNGVSYNRKTNEDGYASLKIQLNPGTYTVTAEYNGFSVSNNIIVKSTLITKDKTVKKAKKFKYTAKLIDSKGKVLKGKKITFKFKGKKYKAKTNKKGKAKVTVKNNKKTGKFTMFVSYKKLQVKNIITVKK